MHRLQDTRGNPGKADSLTTLPTGPERSGSRPAAGRFAPSPTGALHFGSLLAALASYCQSRQQGEHWFLRIDDIDGPRSVPGSADAIQNSLERLGFEWDGPVIRQGHHLQRYRSALQQLIDLDRVFACNCSRKSLAGSPVYPGHCRHQALTHFPVADHAVRIRLSGMLQFEDGVQGLQRFDLGRDVGDSIVWRRDGLVSYALACAVDDADTVSQVVRGADLLAGTGVQLAIIKALGLTPPRYAHVPVARDANGDKLSKHSQARAIDTYDAMEILQQAWQVLGQSPLTDVGCTREFWSRAFAQWRLERVPRLPQITV